MLAPDGPSIPRLVTDGNAKVIVVIAANQHCLKVMHPLKLILNNGLRFTVGLFNIFSIFCGH